MKTYIIIKTYSVLARSKRDAAQLAADNRMMRLLDTQVEPRSPARALRSHRSKGR